MRSGVTTSEAQALRREGAHIRGSAISIRHLPSDEYRYSPVLSRRQGPSVARNRVKRVIRELMRHAADRFPAGLYFVYPKGSCEEFDRETVVRELDTLADRIAASQSRDTP